MNTDDIKWYQSQVMGDTENNGGPPSSVEIYDGEKNNVWPDVTATERETGSVKYRKAFIGVDTEDGTGLGSVKVYVQEPPKEHRVEIAIGTRDGVLAEAEEIQDWCGSAFIAAGFRYLRSALAVYVGPERSLVPREAFPPGRCIRLSGKDFPEVMYTRVKFVRGWRNDDSAKAGLVLLGIEDPLPLELLGRRSSGGFVSEVIEARDIFRETPLPVWERRTIPAGMPPGSQREQVIIGITGKEIPSPVEVP